MTNDPTAAVPPQPSGKEPDVSESQPVPPESEPIWPIATRAAAADDDGAAHPATDVSPERSGDAAAAEGYPAIAPLHDMAPHDPPAQTAPASPGPSARAQGPRSPRGSARLVFAAALLSAVVASASTFGIAELNRATTPATAQAPAATANAQLTSAGGSAVSDATSVIASAEQSVVTITTQSSEQTFRGSVGVTGVGSGVIISSTGLILTNNHVVSGATSVTVTLPSGKDVSGTVLKTDPARDLALVKVNATGLHAATLGSSSSLRIGQTLYAIGTPLGEYSGSVTEGIVSAMNRTITVSDASTGTQTTLSGLIQTDAAINPGNSGGPLIDSTGAVVGLATAGSESAQGIGFAVPIDVAKTFIASANVA